VLSDQNLSEAVFTLQRHDLAPEVREVVEEAARLLGEGREGEARALVEKAEALIAMARGSDTTAGKVNGAVTGNGNRAPMVEALIAPLAAKLATGFTGVLTSVLEEIHHYTGDQIQAVAKSLQDHIAQMQTALRDFAGVGERLEQLANEQHAGLLSLRQGQDDLWTAVRALQAADGEQNESIARVSSTTEELSNHLVIHVDGVASRFAAMEERLTALDQFAQDIQPQLDTIAARLDGQTETLLHLEQRQVQRVATLNQVLDSLARLREPEPAEVGLPAVA
jgi:DNA repair exonuclease SbcCD ATPase subunit